MDPVLQLAAANRQRAQAIVGKLQIEEIWRSAGAEPRLVGSLRMGLLVRHRDIDYHIYSPQLRLSESFAAMARLAENPRIRRIEFANLLDAPDRCLEWHAWYEDDERQLWQIDMIHMQAGSPWDGWFERMADRITAALTDETRTAILRLKYDTPDERKIPGIAYYMAVLRDGVRTWPQLEEWLAAHPLDGIVEWMPEESRESQAE